MENIIIGDSIMDTSARFELIKSVGEEVITEQELRELLQTKSHPVAYDGFEPSGTDIHIAQGLLRAMNINKMTQAGCKFKILVADWHAWANNKMGGNLDRIQKVGKYLIEVWKACGMDPKKVKFVWASELVKDDEYWKKVMQIARNSTVKRMIRCGQIMGRKEGEVLQASQILYPCMQCADIFHLKAEITQLGMDQRRVNMFARDVGPALGFWKPIVVGHHMLSSLSGLEKVNEETKEIGLAEEEEILGNYLIQLIRVVDPKERRQRVGGIGIANLITSAKMIYGEMVEDEKIAEVVLKDLRGNQLEKIALIRGEGRSTKTGIGVNCLDIQRSPDRISIRVSPGKLQLTAAVKMSKSRPETAIFMSDSEEEIRKKIDKAYCPEGVIKDNPILEYYKYLIFEKFKTFRIERPRKWGGDIDFENYNELENVFKKKEIHPLDLKRGVAEHLNMLLRPVRKRLGKSKIAKKLVKDIATFNVTR